MPKKPKKEEPPPSSRISLAILAVGGLVVAALVVWALTRTVETHSPVAMTETSAPVTSGTSGLAPSPTTSAQPVTEESFSEESKSKVPRIAVEDLREKMKAGQVTVIDVRPAASYQTAHIQGAINIPLASIETEMAMLPKGKPIVTYCT